MYCSWGNSPTGSTGVNRLRETQFLHRCFHCIENNKNQVIPVSTCISKYYLRVYKDRLWVLMLTAVKSKNIKADSLRIFSSQFSGFVTAFISMHVSCPWERGCRPGLFIPQDCFLLDIIKPDIPLWVTSDGFSLPASLFLSIMTQLHQDLDLLHLFIFSQQIYSVKTMVYDVLYGPKCFTHTASLTPFDMKWGLPCFTYEKNWNTKKLN